MILLDAPTNHTRQPAGAVDASEISPPPGTLKKTQTHTHTRAHTNLSDIRARNAPGLPLEHRVVYVHHQAPLSALLVEETPRVDDGVRQARGDQVFFGLSAHSDTRQAGKFNFVKNSGMLM